MPTGDPIAVTYVEAGAAADSLIRASYQNPPFCVLPDGVTMVSPAEYFRTLGVTGAYMTEGQIITTVVIINTLDQPLALAGMWPAHGYQTGYPDASNRVGGWLRNVHPGSWEFKDTIGASQPGDSLLVDQIPGALINPSKPASVLFGLGMYRFQAVGLYGNGGAMEFSYGGSAYLGISWMAPYTGTNSRIGVAADMSSYSSDLQTFYDATADGSTNAFSSLSSEIEICGNLWFRPKGEGPFTDASAQRYWDKSPVLIVSVRKR